MKIIVARTAGFCMGVKRVVDLALENASKSPNGISTLGPIIHNNQTVEMLRQRRVFTLEKGALPAQRSTVLIRAHGVPPDEQQRCAERGHQIIDGTCPKVKTVHKVIARFREQGYAIVIAGDQGHAEVVGLLGYAGSAGHLIQSVDDIAKLPDFAKVCLVSQTTFDRTTFDTIADAVRERYGSSEVVVRKTICAATDQRQAETEKLAGQVDAMIVVGGKNSANTQRLAKISEESGTPTQHIETEQEIDWDRIAHCRTIGITAGASTPNWMIKRVHDHLQFLDQTRKRSFANIVWHTFDLLANLNVLLAIGAVAVYYASCLLQGYQFSVYGAALAFLYFLSMYLWNSLGSIEMTQHLGLSRFRVYNARKTALHSLSGASIVATLLLGLLGPRSLLYLTLFATIAGLLYHTTIVPGPLRGLIHYKRLKDIPTSRDLFVALAWGTLLTFIPHAIESSFQIRPLSIAVFAWIFILAYLRSLIFDLRDIEGDRIMGRETLITIVGEKRARKAIYAIIWCCVVILLASPAMLGFGTYRKTGTLRFLFQIPVLFYAGLFVKYNPRIRSNRSALFSFLADSLFYLAGIGAWIAAELTG